MRARCSPSCCARSPTSTPPAASAGNKLGGALKNVIAIAAGVAEGLGLGHNALAGLITRAGFPIVRRSQTKDKAAGDDCRAGVLCPVVLGDTMGELRKFYSVADVVFVGRTLLDLGPRQRGSDMIEPAALANVP